jgi:hypothetical protein
MEVSDMRYFKKTSGLILAICLSLFLWGCDEGNPGGAEALIVDQIDGLVLSKDGQDLVVVEGYDVDGEVAIKLQNRQPHEDFRIAFIDENREELDLTGTNLKLNPTCSDEQRAKMQVNDDVNYWCFCIQGQNCGETTFNVELMTANPGITEYESPGIPLKVIE